jgi:hypothetical protein
MSNNKHSVEIIVKNGDFTYRPGPTVQVKRGHDIEWVCSTGDYAVHLGWESPCEKGRYRAGKGEPVTGQVLQGAPYGRYKYSVAVHQDGKVWTDDPDIIVRR